MTPKGTSTQDLDLYFLDPCTDALIEAQVKRVVCCITDPNPQVNGRGVAALRDAGITVIVQELLPHEY